MPSPFPGMDPYLEGDLWQEFHDRLANQISVQLLEVDLIRRGGRIPLEGELPPAPYYTFLSRFNRRPVTEVWAISLREPLPVMPVPLLPPDEDVPLDLQAAVNACFDLVGYERLLNYREAPPPPPFSEADAAWIAECIEAAGLSGVG